MGIEGKKGGKREGKGKEGKEYPNAIAEKNADGWNEDGEKDFDECGRTHSLWYSIYLSRSVHFHFPLSPSLPPAPHLFNCRL